MWGLQQLSSCHWLLVLVASQQQCCVNYLRLQLIYQLSDDAHISWQVIIYYVSPNNWELRLLFCHFSTTSFPTSVGSNPKIMNSELLQTLEVELRTLSNPGLPTKTELRTHPNPPKIQNSEPTNPTTINILENQNNKHQTASNPRGWTLNHSEPRFANHNRTTNPPKIPNSDPRTGFDPTLFPTTKLSRCFIPFILWLTT